MNSMHQKLRRIMAMILCIMIIFAAIPVTVGANVEVNLQSFIISHVNPENSEIYQEYIAFCDVPDTLGNVVRAFSYDLTGDQGIYFEGLTTNEGEVLSEVALSITDYDGNELLQTVARAYEPIYLEDYSNSGLYRLYFKNNNGDVIFDCVVVEHYGDPIDLTTLVIDAGEEPTPVQPAEISTPSISVEPVQWWDGDTAVVGYQDLSIYWGSEGQVDYYVVRVDDMNDGYSVLPDSATTDTMITIPAEGYMVAGHTYQISVSAMPVNGSDGDQKSNSFRFYVDVPAPVVAEIGEVSIGVEPTNWVDGDVHCVNAASDYKFTWHADGEVEAYYVELKNANGYDLFAQWTTDKEITVYADQLEVGDYTLRVGAKPVNGSDADVKTASIIIRVEKTSNVEPATEVPVTEVPITEVPVTEVPVTEVPVTEVPVTEVPVTEVPVTEVPVTEVPVTEVPVTEVPVTEVPVTEVPVTEAPVVLPACPIIYVNGVAQEAGARVEVDAAARVSLQWNSTDADLFFFAMNNRTTNEELQAMLQTTGTAMDIETGMLQAGNEYEVFVGAARAGTGSANVIWTSLIISVRQSEDNAEEFVQKTLKPYIVSGFTPENDIFAVPAEYEIRLAWEALGSEGYSVYIEDETAGVAVGEYQNVIVTDFSIAANLLDADHVYRFEVSALPQGNQMVLPGSVRFKAVYPVVTVTPEPIQEDVTLAIGLLKANGEYRKVEGVGTVPLDVYYLPEGENPQLVISSSNGTLPAYGMQLANYSSQETIFSTDGNTAPTWTTVMDALNAGDIYVLQVWPTGRTDRVVSFYFARYAEEIPENSEFNVYLMDRAQVVNYSIGKSTYETKVLPNIINAQIQWTSYANLTTYRVGIYERDNMDQIRLISEQVFEGNGCIIYAEKFGFVPKTMYEIRVTPLGSEGALTDQAKSLFLIFDGEMIEQNTGGGIGGMVSLVTPSGMPGVTMKPVQTTPRPAVTLKQKITAPPRSDASSVLDQIELTTARPTDSLGIDSLYPSFPTIAPNSPNATDGSSSLEIVGLTTGSPLVSPTATGSSLLELLPTITTPEEIVPKAPELFVDGGVQYIEQGMVEALKGSIVSGSALDDVQIIYEDMVLFSQENVNSAAFDLKAYKIDTVNDAFWKERIGEVTLEVYASVVDKTVQETINNTVVNMVNQLPGLSLPASLPSATESVTAPEAIDGVEKVGDVVVYIKQLADAYEGSGTGLQLSLSNLNADMTLGMPRDTELIESDINFEWQAAAMLVDGVDVSSSGMEWKGWVQAKYSGKVKFHVYATNGVKLSIGGRVRIDEWEAQPVRTHSTDWIDVTAGQKYIIELANFTADSGGSLALSWEYQGRENEKEIVPERYLYSTSEQLLGGAAREQAAMTYGLDAVQAKALEHILYFSDDEAVRMAVDAGKPIVFLLEGAGQTTEQSAGSLHTEGRMEAMMVVVHQGEVVQFASSASTLPDIPKAAASVLDGSAELTLNEMESSEGKKYQILIGKANILSSVDETCDYCYSRVLGNDVWHSCYSEEHGLMIAPSDTWAIRESEVDASRSITLLPEDYAELAGLLAEGDGTALMVVDRYYMDKNRLDYSWLYDTVGLEKLSEQ